MKTLLLGDPALPTLALACDAEAVGASLAPVLRERWGDDVALERCAVERVRHRPGRRAVIQYRMDLVHRASRARRAHWVSGTLYPGDKAAGTFRRLRRDSPANAPDLEGTPFAGALYLRDARLLVQSFPVDRHLPGLGCVTGDGAAEIGRLLAARCAGAGAHQIAMSLAAARYRPGLGATLRARVLAASDGGDRRRRDFYLKIVRPDAFPDAVDTMQPLASLAACAAGFSVSVPVASLEACQALVTDAAPGTPLDRLMCTDDGRHAAARAGEALAALHASAARPARRFETIRLRARINRAVTPLAWACPRLARDLERLRQGLERAVPATQWCPAHLDLKPEHVLLDGDRATFIDLESHALADPLLDVGSMLVRLDPAFAGAGRRPATGVADAFLHAYVHALPSTRLERLGHACAVALVQIALHFRQHLVPGWEDRVAHAVAAARRALGDSGRG